MGECHSPPAHMALGYPYFPEIRGTDGRTSQNYKRGSLLTIFDATSFLLRNMPGLSNKTALVSALLKYKLLKDREKIRDRNLL